MNWDYSFSESARKCLKKLGHSDQERIIKFLKERIKGSSNPRMTGKALSGSYAGLWRYRVGDYRIICQLQDAVVTVLVVTIGHRREVYR